jgi:hypothetical protein
MVAECCPSSLWFGIVANERGSLQAEEQYAHFWVVIFTVAFKVIALSDLFLDS